jgi:hypothetical protein
MPEAATSVATWSTKQWMVEMVHNRIAAGETTVVSTAAVLWCAKQMEKLPHYNFSRTVSLQKICEMLRLEISSRSHSLENWVRKRLWTCRETDKYLSHFLRGPCRIKGKSVCLYVYTPSLLGNGSENIFPLQMKNYRTGRFLCGACSIKVK